MTNTHEWTKDELVRCLKDAGIKSGTILNVRASLKSIGRIKGGVDTFLEAILDVIGPEGTLIVNSFINCYPIPLSETDAKNISTEASPSYAGALANAILKHPDCVRSKHPIQKFAAVGKLAHELMDNHTPDSDGYAVFERLGYLGAFKLCIGREAIEMAGVGNTHAAIKVLGFFKKKPNRGVNYLAEDGTVKLYKVNWNGGCSRGFPKFHPLYEKAGALKHVRIGEAEAVLSDMKRTLEIDCEKLEADPSFFFCDDPTCKDCRLNWEHSTGNYLTVKFYSLISIIKSKL